MTNKRLNCIYCNFNSVILYKIINNYKVYYCRNCDLRFTLNAAYKSRSFNKTYYSNNYLNNFINREDILAKRFIKHINLIDRKTKGGKILDVGCGTGLFLDLVDQTSTNKWKLYGVEINKLMCSYAKKKTKAFIYHGSLNSLYFPSNSFDCITCFDVLEHIHDLKSILDEIKRILKKDGLLVIQAPNSNSIMAYICGDFWDWWSVPDHIYHFTYKSLKRLIENFNFSINLIYTWDDNIDFINNILGLIKSKLNKSLLISKAIRMLIKIIFYVVKPLLGLLKKLFNIGGLTVIYAQNK